MTDLNPSLPASSVTVKIIGSTIAIVALAGFLPILMMMLGSSFLPSMEWAKASIWPATYFGIALGVVTVYLVVRQRHLNPQLQDASFLKLGFTCLVVTALMWMLAFISVVTTIPMVEAWVSGDEVRLPYVVDDPVGSGSRGCRQSVELRGMPFLFDSICGTSPELQQALQEGQTVYVLGNGTQHGVFYNRVEW